LSTELKTRYDNVVSRITSVCLSSNREASEVELIAVSKKHSCDSIKDVYELGQRSFGENYASELFSKAEQLSGTGINWVFIGALQSNKIARLVKICSEIQTISSVKHLRYVNRYAEEYGKVDFPVYLQVNIADEPQKSGFSAMDIKEIVTTFDTYKSLQLKGLMAIPPQNASKVSASGKIPSTYMDVKRLTSELELKHLSLGMSADLEAAIAVGSTCIRIGSDIFGPRPS
jgi:PLP dependent protein